MFPYGKLDPENDWVRLAALVPWEVAEERYAARFVNNGHPAHPARMALGALVIQRRLKCSDQWLVKHIGENPYLQYFIGMKEYGACPFGASTLVAFRKRFSEEDLAAILEASVPQGETEKKDDSDDGNDPPNSGTLVLDATCCPVDIAYPQDIDLLNQAREKAEKTVDELCEMTKQKRPRMYRKRARKDYLRLSKSKKRSGKAIRSAVRKQLQYIRRDIGYIAELVQKGAKLSSKQADRLNVVTTVYEQQRIMFESGTHSIPRRIVSLAQPWVRPIVRGKAHANTEFSPKLHISLVDGYARIERLDFEPFNESEDLWRAVARYRERYGCYPERILADKIYRTRQTLAFCKEHGIRLSGPALGKPSQDPLLSRQAKKLEYQDSCDRNAVEGVFGTGKTAYGLGRIMARLQETAVCVIGVALLLLNLSKSLRTTLALFCRLAVLAFLRGLRSSAYLYNITVRYYNLWDNPCKKAGSMGKKKNREMSFWTKAEYLKFAETMMDKPLSYYAFEMLYWCGIREGELLALTPADFDFEKCTVSISKSYRRLNGQNLITTPKTEKSNRVITNVIKLLLLRAKIGKAGVQGNFGNDRGVMLQFAHEGLNLTGDVIRSIRQLARMNRKLQSMIQIFIQVVFRSIGRQEKHLNFLLVLLQPCRSKLAMMDLRLWKNCERKLQNSSQMISLAFIRLLLNRY